MTAEDSTMFSSIIAPVAVIQLGIFNSAMVTGIFFVSALELL
jgi:hypothetical protein